MGDRPDIAGARRVHREYSRAWDFADAHPDSMGLAPAGDGQRDGRFGRLEAPFSTGRRCNGMVRLGGFGGFDYGGFGVNKARDFIEFGVGGGFVR